MIPANEKAPVVALTEMHEGVLTRKVKAITRELCGHEFTVSTIRVHRVGGTSCSA